MPYLTLSTRTKTGTGADADPNSSAPSTADVLEHPSVQRANSQPVKGWVYYLVFLDAAGDEVAGGTATLTPWIYDELDGSWASAQSDSSVGNRQLYQTAHFFNASKLFFQLTDIAGAGVASVEVRLGSF